MQEHDAPLTTTLRINRSGWLGTIVPTPRASRAFFPAYGDAMFQLLIDGAPVPPIPASWQMGQAETWCNLFVALFCLFWLVMLLLPSAWFVAVFEIAFPFLPRPKRD